MPRTLALPLTALAGVAAYASLACFVTRRYLGALALGVVAAGAGALALAFALS